MTWTTRVTLPWSPMRSRTLETELTCTLGAPVNQIGYWSGLAACASTVAYVLVQLLQVVDVLHFPLDGIAIFGTSLCIVVPLVLEMLSLHYLTDPGKRFWTHAALIFTTLYAVFVTANYVVQLATVIPFAMKGKLGEVQILQQTPHSLFWDLDALGYIFMGLTCLTLIPVFQKKGFQKWVRLSLIANAAVTPLITIVYFYPTYSSKLLILGLPWALTAPLFMLMLARWFRKANIQSRKIVSVIHGQDALKQ